jgi:hypothetical protein
MCERPGISESNAQYDRPTVRARTKQNNALDDWNWRYIHRQTLIEIFWIYRAGTPAAALRQFFCVARNAALCDFSSQK